MPVNDKTIPVRNSEAADASGEIKASGTASCDM